MTEKKRSAGRVTASREIRWLAAQIRPFVPLHFGSYCGIVIAAILVIIDPLIVRFLIDEVMPRGRVTWLPLVALAFLLTDAGRLGAESLASMLSFRAVQKMTYRMRLSLLRHLQRLSAEYHEHPRVLILDECTSALDALTEQWLFSGLDSHLRGVTTIVISHRSYPLQWADRVIRIESVSSFSDIS